MFQIYLFLNYFKSLFIKIFVYIENWLSTFAKGLLSWTTLIHVRVNLLVTSQRTHQVSIWPTFYEQLLTTMTPKRWKRHIWLDFLFALLGSGHEKASSKHVGEIDISAAENSDAIIYDFFKQCYEGAHPNSVIF